MDARLTTEEPRKDDPEGRSPLEDDLEALRARLGRYRRASAALRSSIRFRIGDAVVRAARNPRDAVRLPKTLVRLYREGKARGDWEGEMQSRDGGRRPSALPPPPPPGSAPLRKVVLFFAINGVGLGHLTRALAVARHLGELRPLFVTTCRRAHVLDRYGIPYYFVPSQQELIGPELLSDPTAWNFLLRLLMNELLDAHRPAAIVVDATMPYAGLCQAWSEVPEVGRVAIRRAYKQDGRERRILERDRELNLVLIPHEPAEESVPVPEGTPSVEVGNLVVVGRDEALPRDRARRELDLPPDDPCVLIQLGAGVLGSGGSLRDALIAHLARRGVRAVVASYDPAGERTVGSVSVVSKFPLAAYLGAFDLAVAATGYNTYAELMHHGVPTIFVPNERTVSDDQVARARRAGRAGAAVVVREGDEAALLGAVDRLLGDAGSREALRAAASQLVPRNGGPAAADVLKEFCFDVLGRRSAPR